MPKPKTLSDKQKLFCLEYLVDLNGKQAAIRSGYSKKTAEVQASRLLSNAKVKKFIDKAVARRAEKLEITTDKVVQELAKIGFADIRKAVRWGANPLDESAEFADPNGLGFFPVSLVPSELIDDYTAAAVSEVSLTAHGIKIKMHDKKAALESLMKHTGGYELDNSQKGAARSEELERLLAVGRE